MEFNIMILEEKGVTNPKIKSLDLIASNFLLNNMITFEWQCIGR